VNLQIAMDEAGGADRSARLLFSERADLSSILQDAKALWSAVGPFSAQEFYFAY
jgi:hypothetical protein